MIVDIPDHAVQRYSTDYKSCRKLAARLADYETYHYHNCVLPSSEFGLLASPLETTLDIPIRLGTKLLANITHQGTFLCGLFGMNMFDFDNGSFSVSPRFWIYWAIWFPLTFLTFVTWSAWVYRARLLPRYFSGVENGVSTRKSASIHPEILSPVAEPPDIEIASVHS